MIRSTIPSPRDTLSQRVSSRTLRRAGLSLLVLSLLAVQPAMAQDQGAICSAANLPSMIEGFFQMTTGLGIVGLAILWQADALIKMFTLDPDQKKILERHRRSATKSAGILVVLGPLYTVAGSVMGLPLAQCVNLVPW